MLIELNGPPLSEIVPGLWELQMRDGSELLAIVNREDDGPAWWAPLCEPGATVDCSTDWTNVSGARMVSFDEAARRVPHLGLPTQVLAPRSDPAAVSISGRGYSPS